MIRENNKEPRGGNRIQEQPEQVNNFLEQDVNGLRDSMASFEDSPSAFALILLAIFNLYATSAGLSCKTDPFNTILIAETARAERFGIVPKCYITEASFSDFFYLCNALVAGMTLFPLIKKDIKYKYMLWVGILWNSYTMPSFFLNGLQLINDCVQVNIDQIIILKMLVAVIIFSSLHLYLLLKSIEAKEFIDYYFEEKQSILSVFKHEFTKNILNEFGIDS